MNEGTLFWRCGRDSVGLCHHFFEKDLRRHSSRGHAFAHLLDGLVEQAGKQFQSGDVILIVFYILEGENADQLRSVNVNSVELVYGHLPRLKARAFQVHLKIANHDLLVERFLDVYKRQESGRVVERQVSGVRSQEKPALRSSPERFENS